MMFIIWIENNNNLISFDDDEIECVDDNDQYIPFHRPNQVKAKTFSNLVASYTWNDYNFW